jgi:predicted nucleotidyltransferase component of viral defense system
MTTPGFDLPEARGVAAEFGVALEQIRRDHLISHILAALSRRHRDQLIFFGGTALARSYLPHGRLSEDIDLIAVGPRSTTAAAIERTLASALRRSHGRIAWAPALTAVHDTDPAVLVADDGRLAVRVQLLDALGYPPWPTEIHALQQRYRDAPPATLRVPTIESFAAWKTVALIDRGAPRDLYDLWALAGQGAITTHAAELFSAYGPTGKPPQPWMFTTAPDEKRWTEQLSNQTTLTVSAADALRVVADTWAGATGSRTD